MSGNRGSALHALARLVGVAVKYEAADRVHRPPESTLRAVLSAMGHPCDDEQATARSLRILRRRPWETPLDPVVSQWQGAPQAAHVTLSARAGVAPQLELTLEDGTRRVLPSPVWGGHKLCAGGYRVRGSVPLPGDLPLGYHQLVLDDGEQQAQCTVIVAPPRCPAPDGHRRWGWMAQIYAVRSGVSWGQGEFRDLAELASWSATQGADFILTNPLHAPAPVVPQQPSPYSPSSRRFANPCYLHIPDLPEFAALPPHRQHALTTLPPVLAAATDRIDRDAVWQYKRAVLGELFAGMADGRRQRLNDYRRQEGPSLDGFATYCALAELHGLPFDDWPPELRDARSVEVAQWASQHADAVAFHAWLQLCCSEQLAAVQRTATAAGMAIGIINDLAVGAEPHGADAWTLPDQIARKVSVGAPPDAFNPLGQNWGLPPLLPEPLRRTGYQTLRELLRASLSGGGLRIDHILGLQRLFWIPHGATAAAGTYVQYPVEEQFAVLVLEAHRADAIIVGEDLGTVDERLRTLMRRHGVLSSAVLYFEREGVRHRPARAYPRVALASVGTHDLPTATGFWDGSALRLRAELDLLDQQFAVAQAVLVDEQRHLLALLRASGCLTTDHPDVRECVLAMHRFLAATRSVLVAGALWDALGDARQPNVPGTVDSYPNWQLPLAQPTPTGVQPVTLDALQTSPAVRDLIATLRRKR